jgi:hypothetical protein
MRGRVAVKRRPFYNVIMARRAVTTALLVAVVALAPARSAAQRLTIQGDRFAVDGTPRFLTFISYFDAMEALDLTADLEFLHEMGLDGVRIWPNPGLIRSNGTLDTDALSRLLFILDAARRQRVIVDVTFTAERVAGLDAAHFRDGIVATARAIAGYDNALIDIQNERDVYGPFVRPLAPSDVAATAAAIKQADPRRIVTASNSPGLTPAAAARFTVDTGLDVTAYHDDRVATWYERGRLQSIVAAMRANGRPAYLQEPTRFPFPSTDRADYFLQARANAKLAGAAAWCFHTEFGFDLRSARFKDRLASRPEPEWTFVNSLIMRVYLKTSDGSHYVVAEQGGGSAVHADRQNAIDWGTFVLSAVAGGPPLDGDYVSLRTFDGEHYLEADGGGGGALLAATDAVGSWETFRLETGAGGAVRDGDRISLQTATQPAWYVTAEEGGGGAVNVNRSVRGDWQIFTIVAVR